MASKNIQKFNKEVSMWAWLGRIAPMTALLSLSLVVTSDFHVYGDYAVHAVAVLFGSIAFFWWWWVLRSVGILTDLLNTTSERFTEVVTELKEIKKDVKELPIKTSPKRKYERKPTVSSCSSAGIKNSFLYFNLTIGATGITYPVTNPTSTDTLLPSVFLRVTPDCITSNPEIVFSASPLSIVNCIGLIINTTSHNTKPVVLK